MRSPETTIIVNPKAGTGSFSTRWPMVASKARTILGPCGIAVSQAPGHAGALAAKAAAGGTRRLVVVGGDGTLNEVVNAVMKLNISIREALRIGVVPIGTGCDFARSLTIPRDVDKALALINAMPTRCVDVGKIAFRNQKNQKSHGFFVNMVSFGLGGEVALQAKRVPQTLGPAFAFFLATAISVLRYGKKEMRLTIDGRKPIVGRFWNIAVGNGNYHGGGMRVTPAASLDDGKFHVTVIGDMSLLRVILNFARLYDGKIHRVEAASDLPVLLEVDGEYPGTLPATLTIEAEAIHIIAQSQPDSNLQSGAHP